MRAKKLILCMFLIGWMLATPVWGDDGDSSSGPWEKFGVNAGVFLSSTSSNMRLGSGVGVSLDVEKLLGLNSTNSVFRIDALWRFSDNRRHRLDLSWFSLRRSGDRILSEDIVIEDPDGGDININTGAQLSTFFNLDIYQFTYSYSFYQDDRIDLAVSAGAYIMPMDFGIKVTGVVDEEGTQKFTAPLPAFGARMDFAITPKWFIRSGFQLFYLEYEQFTGSLIEVRAAIEYLPWKHFGAGLGFDTLAMDLQADGQDYPEIDLRGDVQFQYTGLQLYLKYFF